jgi:hypothetical protein
LALTLDGQFSEDVHTVTGVHEDPYRRFLADVQRLQPPSAWSCCSSIDPTCAKELVLIE